MPTSLLDSQLKALEPLQEDEAGISVSATGTPAATAEAALAQLAGAGPAS
jgi:gluconokinase